MALEDDPHLQELMGRSLSGQLMIKFDATHRVLTDAGGFPLSRSQAKALRALIGAHLRKSSADLSQTAREVIRDAYPTLEEQFNFDVERFE